MLLCFALTPCCPPLLQPNPIYRLWTHLTYFLLSLTSSLSIFFLPSIWHFSSLFLHPSLHSHCNTALFLPHLTRSCFLPSPLSKPTLAWAISLMTSSRKLKSCLQWKHESGQPAISTLLDRSRKSQQKNQSLLLGFKENGVPADNDSILADCNLIQSYNLQSNSDPALLHSQCLLSGLTVCFKDLFQINIDHNPLFYQHL